MNICDDNWAVAHLISLPDDELDQSGKQVARSLAVSKLRTGQVILAMEQTGLPGRLGYKNALHYFKLAGTRYVEARECRRVAKGCEELPILRQAAEAGRVGWTQLREVVRVASPQTEADWVEKCREHTSKQIHEMVKASKGGKIPPVSKPTDGPVQLRMTLSAGMKVLLERVASELSDRAGRALSLRQVVECLLAQHLTGHPFPGEEGWNRLLEEAGEAVAATEEPCSGGPAGQFVKPAGDQPERELTDRVPMEFHGGQSDDFAREVEELELDDPVQVPGVARAASGGLTAAAMLGWSVGIDSQKFLGSLR